MYAAYGNENYNPDEMMDIFNTLINNKEELPSMNIKNIITYCFTRDDKLLVPRAFSSTQKTAMYNRQNGRCASCGQMRFTKNFIKNIKKNGKPHILKK